MTHFYLQSTADNVLRSYIAQSGIFPAAAHSLGSIGVFAILERLFIRNPKNEITKHSSDSFCMLYKDYLLVSINLPLNISGMQQVVCLLASWLTKVSGIQFLNCRILMGLTNGIILIRII